MTRRQTLNQRIRNLERDLGWWWDRNHEGFWVGIIFASAVFGLIAWMK